MAEMEPGPTFTLTLRTYQKQALQSDGFPSCLLFSDSTQLDALD